ncbi:RT0821/Lpp0805 family surface protein [Aestuariispira ectoiniformans]|uniref:RT0821/Lpp0805 family surface protein n=1 Tax=Aestuariispira ectoiniformans TaxID=2775080 RepID=UPI00223ACFB0|nr:RT0821/Lpp0805 family surface protein [Aestuariispira ectoiniformans]
MRKATLSLLLAASLATTGCITGNQIDRKDKLAGGAVVGAVAGGLLGYSLMGGSGASSGSQLLGMALGGAAGGYAGYWAADQMSRWDKSAMQSTAYESLEAGNGQTLSWKNDRSGNFGSFTPLRTFLDHKGRLCRDFVTTINVSGEERKGQQTACKNGAGVWVII